MFTFSDVAPALYKWSRYYENRSCGRHDMWEILSSVWLKGTIQKCDDIRKVSGKTRYEVISYLINADKRRRIHKVVFHNLESDDYFTAKEKPDMVEVRDMVTHLIKSSNLSYREYEIMHMYFWDNMTLSDVSKTTGHSIEFCSVILKKTLAKMKDACEFVESDCYV